MAKINSMKEFDDHIDKKISSPPKPRGTGGNITNTLRRSISKRKQPRL